MGLISGSILIDNFYQLWFPMEHKLYMDIDIHSETQVYKIQLIFRHINICLKEQDPIFCNQTSTSIQILLPLEVER